jgi:hypothetical protein
LNHVVQAEPAGSNAQRLVETVAEALHFSACPALWVRDLVVGARFAIELSARVG